MAELLHIPDIDPPIDVLNHAVLYEDGIATLVPDEFDGHLSDPVRLAADAGLYRPLPARELWQDVTLQAHAWNATWAVLRGRSVLAGELQDLIMERLKAWVKENPKSTREKTRDAFSHDEHRRREAASLSIDHLAWRRAIGEAFDEIWRSRCLSDEVDDWSGMDGMAWGPDIQATILAGTAYSLAARVREDPNRPLLIPHYNQWAMDGIIRHFAVEPSGDHLLLQVDVGRLLPDPVPDADTAALIAFRQRYDDERCRLINAVERLVEQASTTYQRTTDIDRSVRRDLAEALDDMTKAGRRVLQGWSRRLVSVVTATGAAASVGVLAGAPLLLTAGVSVVGAMAVNVATSVVAPSWRDDRFRSFHYLYRLHRELDRSVVN